MFGAHSRSRITSGDVSIDVFDFSFCDDMRKVSLGNEERDRRRYEHQQDDRDDRFHFVSRLV